jgi:glucosamine-6-phosphate deaminase
MNRKRFGMNLIVVDDLKEISKIIINEIRVQLKINKNSIFIFPTGETAKLLYLMISKLKGKNKLDFSNAQFFQLDEFVGLKKGDRRSFTLYLEKRLFSKTNFKQKNIHTFNTASKNPLKDCKLYDKKILKNSVDFCVLGLGENGHIAFNEPGSSIDSKTRIISLAKSTLKTKSKMLASSVPKKAFTVGISTIMMSKKIFVIASGKNKSTAVEFAIKSKKMSDMKKCPLAVLNYHKNAMLVIDKKSASKIK